ncbi:hypothetical protein F5Y14DRAFT_137027 [Nemania sp. NC0429]|nr:hypothetical protein F5Y14DRAFT_137027 [Nemania sp. NC0429]
MSRSSPLHRHQLSLDGVIDFIADVEPLKSRQRAHAQHRFYRIVNHFDPDTNDDALTQYSPPRLVRLTYQHALSEQSRDHFLRAFFLALALSIEDEQEVEDDPEELRLPLNRFADYLMDNLFLPCKLLPSVFRASGTNFSSVKSSAKRTPQPSPASDSAIKRAQEGSPPLGTLDRVSALRGACLIRDHHRCVISRNFDRFEAVSRLRKQGDDAVDDDGNLLREDEYVVAALEVAHILPHSFMTANPDPELTPSKQAALGILNLLDHEIVRLIEGTDIDQPRNAITLTSDLHSLFGDFQIFFEPCSNPHTYRIDSFLPRILRQDPSFPITRTLYLSEHRTIDPPSPRLLAFHCAIAHILHLSGAGEYIDGLLLDLDGQDIRADGSTELDRLVRLRLRGFDDSVRQQVSAHEP